MKPEYLRAEQSDGSQVIDILLTNGGKEKVMEKDVLKFIEEYGLNYKRDYFNVSPGGYDYQEIETPATDYLDDNFEYVCKLYYKHLIDTRK